MKQIKGLVLALLLSLSLFGCVNQEGLEYQEGELEIEYIELKNVMILKGYYKIVRKVRLILFLQNLFQDLLEIQLTF